MEFYHGNATGTGNYFLNSPVFPRITMCDVTVRYLGNVQRHTVQCVLALNYYLEKMYLFFWFWLIFLMLATVIDMLLWFFRFLIRRDRLNFVRNHLNAGGFLKSEWDDQMTGAFLDHYLRQDGAFLLRMIAQNTNSITTADITGTLWQIWKDRQHTETENNDEPGECSPFQPDKQPSAPPQPADGSPLKPETEKQPSARPQSGIYQLHPV
jgi:hypothetical protein